MQPNANATSLPGEVLSPSQASTFLSCSAKWWFRYGLGLPDPASGAAARGRAVHKAIEQYMRAKIAGVILDAADLAGDWDMIWDEVATEAEFAADDDVEDLKASGARLAHKYLAEAAPAIEPAAVEVPVSGSIAGVPVRGIIDIIDGEGRVIDIKTTSRKPSKISGDHAFQLSTYIQLLGDGGSGEARLDSLVATKKPQLVQIEHTPDESGEKLVGRMYPLVAEGIAGGLYLPNRSSNVCSRRYCAFADACEREFGGSVPE
jgi:RecB family exonuclease